jgi:F0F1-type ATP synthase assembly protein I
MTPAPKNEDPDAKGYSQGYEYFGMAFTFAIAIVLFGAAGWFVDGWVHTRPLLTIIGAFVGGFAGFMSIYYRVKRDTEKR